MYMNFRPRTMMAPMAGAAPMMGTAPSSPSAPGQKGPGGVIGALNNKLNETRNRLDARLPYFEEDRNRLGGMLDGRSPYAGQEWGGLISQLQQQASGKGPS